ncbi:GDSL-like lipase/Acylhydrolase family protein [Sarocladium implicatum]|nr:GDSL-like lipase/Acylhydrolase family protein [Sarocladium implicatum]
MLLRHLLASLAVGSQAVGAIAFVLPFNIPSWGRLRPGSITVQTSHADTQLPLPPHFLESAKAAPPSTGFVAFGDSYSAGIGTGFNGTENTCRRGLGAYPQLIHRDFTSLVGSQESSFQHLACTGATLQDVISSGNESHPSQVDDFNTTADFALLSIGGNDLGFFDIMNSCIFRFYSFYSGTCEAALARSEEAIQDPSFAEDLRTAIVQILERVRWERRLWFTVTVTGYARFFNDETDECDECSLGVWWRGPKLKKDLRRRMNDMVKSVNRKIRESVDQVNKSFAVPRVLFVDYDAAFEGHRFCEPNVTEPDYARNETWFFHVGGQDNGNNWNSSLPLRPPPPEDEDPERPAPDHPSLPPESPLVNPETCLEPAQRSGDWGQLALCLMAKAAIEDPTIRSARGELVIQNSMWHAPTYYGKTFHPVGPFNIFTVPLLTLFANCSVPRAEK